VINGKILIIISVLVASLILVGGSYYIGTKSGANECLAENNIHVAKVLEDALNERTELEAKHQNEVAKYVKSMESETSKLSTIQSRLRKIQASRSNVVCDISSGANDLVIELFNEAINSQALLKSTDKPFTLGEEGTIENYSITNIEKYNACAIQLNALIDSVNTP